jgi:hypothetical protein
VVGEDIAHGPSSGVGVSTNPRQFEMHPNRKVFAKIYPASLRKNKKFFFQIFCNKENNIFQFQIGPEIEQVFSLQIFFFLLS